MARKIKREPKPEPKPERSGDFRTFEEAIAFLQETEATKTTDRSRRTLYRVSMPGRADYYYVVGGQGEKGAAGAVAQKLGVLVEAWSELQERDLQNRCAADIKGFLEKIDGLSKEFFKEVRTRVFARIDRESQNE